MRLVFGSCKTASVGSRMERTGVLRLLVSLAAFSHLLTLEAKVLELSDKFVPLRREGMWLVKFYAPWCGHCKKLEPVFKHVSQSLAHEPIRIGRIDCTRFPTVATEFGIKGYPTILFLKGDKVFTYEGDRTRDDLVQFSQRLLGPPVKEIKSSEALKAVLDSRDINFVFVGERNSELWDSYFGTASTYQQHEFFYRVAPDVAQKLTNVNEDNVIRVFKDGSSYLYSDDNQDREQRSLEDHVPTTESTGMQIETPNAGGEEEEKSSSSLMSWVTRERFPMFVKITRGKFHHLMSTKKYVVMAVLEENRIGELTPEMEEFRDMLRVVVERNRDRYRQHFQFGWTGSPELANSVAMETLSLPNLLVVNASSFQHHLPDDDPTQLTPEAIQIWLDEILEGSAPVYGGSSYSVRLYRSIYEAKSSVSEMWKGNPALTALLFGLPLGFFALICYSICCADIMDADEEDEEDDASYHEKND